MKKSLARSLAGLGAIALTVAISSVVQPAQAADCRYDQWGSNQFKGQKYKCSDGSSMYIKPPSYSSDPWDSTPKNSWDKWKGTDNSGNRYGCTWDNWRGQWKCR